jgi:hypothetical protein
MSDFVYCSSIVTKNPAEGLKEMTLSQIAILRQSCVYAACDTLGWYWTCGMQHAMYLLFST